ncbi:ribose-phosphate diphosphokinase [Candidatus Dependentiae bacterium]|nr:ribose-phosphate diphosphokinase [Candidatus Dependentiae bacterium]
MIFYTTSAKRFAKTINDEAKFLLKQFSDGETYLKIEEDIDNKTVWIISSTQSPNDNLIELIFLIDAISNMDLKINLLITYFGYARQDKPKKGEPASAKIILNILKNYNLNKFLILHIHDDALTNILKFEDIILFDFFNEIIKLHNIEIIIAPDKGAKKLVETLAKVNNCGTGFIEKFRPEQEHAEIIKFTGDAKNKNVLIVDDLIATGTTLLNAARVLYEHGAKDICIAATHGIFTENSVPAFEKSKINKIYVTNSVRDNINSEKIVIKDISMLLKKLLK